MQALNFDTAIWLTLSSLLFSFFFTWLAISFSPSLGLVDKPDQRKAHANHVPRAGGLAIALAMAGAFAVLTTLFPNEMVFSKNWSVGLMGCLCLLLTVGLIDDLRGLPWQPRLLIHFAAAIFFFFQLQEERSSPLPLPLLALGVFFLVLITNAFNMIDGMDLLAGGTGFLIGLALLLFWLHFSGDGVVWALALLAALPGFLFFNRPPGRIFLGEAGSTTLGFLLASLAINLLSNMDFAWNQVAGLIFLFLLPLYDLFTVVGLRLCQGNNPFHGDRQHLAHRLLNQGYSPWKALLILFGFSLCGILTSFGLFDSKRNWFSLLLIVWQSAVVAGFFFIEYARGNFHTSFKKACPGGKEHR